MCNQAVCLAAAEFERNGIATVALVLLRQVAARMHPPRALALPFRHGYPLDTPHDPARQHAVLEAALRLFETPAAHAPLIVDYDPAANPGERV
jgi:hypothetical protein